MPKDRRVNSSSLDRAMVSPSSCSQKIPDRSSPLVGDEREWEEARCPICMEHPHNAVLLLCSSRGKGCRPFICDTSYRHSNCLDQLRKSADESSLLTPFDQQKCEFVCPLCRGLVTGWDVIHPAREFMNSKTRSCSLETCNFDGNYAELRKHARLEHPSERPSEARPDQQLNWLELERQREMEDVLALQADFEGWLNLDHWTADIWSDESFFDFSSGMSDNDNESMSDMLSGLNLSLTFCPSSPDETTDSRSSDGPPTVLPANSILRSDISHTSRSILRNHSEDEGAVSRSRLGYRRENDSSMNVRSVSGLDRENGLTNLNLSSDYHREHVPRRPRTSYPRGNASTNLRSISSSRRENASNNVSSSARWATASRSRSSYSRGNGPSSSSRARSSYFRENGPSSSSRARSSYFRENAPSSSSSSRARSSYFSENGPSSSRGRWSYRREDAWPSSSSRARTTFNPREEALSRVSRIRVRAPSRMPHSGHGRRQG